MPEGHTLFRLARDLDGNFRRPDRPGDQPAGAVRGGRGTLDGHRVESAESAGKHLFVRFDHDQVLHVHLGLIGGFLVAHGPAPTPVGQVRVRLETPTSYAASAAPPLASLSTRTPCASRSGSSGRIRCSDADPAKAWHRIHRSSKPIGALLLDQRVLAGVGNVYRAESLFRARLHPLTPGVEVSRARRNAVLADLVDLMAYGVRTGEIDTVRVEHEPEARVARLVGRPHGRSVYRRQGQPCHVCGTRVRTPGSLKGETSSGCCQRRR